MNDNFIRNESFAFYRLPIFSLNTAKAIISKLYNIVEFCDKVDVLHFFGSPSAARPYYYAASALDIKFCITIPGGKPPRTFYGIKNAVAYTNEIPEKLIIDEQIKLSIMPSRIEKLVDFNYQATRNSLRNKLEKLLHCNSDTIIIGRIARCTMGYSDEIIQTAKEVSKLSKMGIDIRFCHIGYRHSTRAGIKIKRSLRNFNKNGMVALSIQKKLSNVWQYAAAFDVQLSAGRSSLEGMQVGTPQMQYLGNKKFILMDEKSTNELIKVNFSSRNKDKLINISEDLYSILKSVKDQSKKNQIKKCYHNVINYYDVDNASEFYMNYYHKIQKNRTNNFLDIKYFNKSLISIIKDCMNRVVLLK